MLKQFLFSWTLPFPQKADWIILSSFAVMLVLGVIFKISQLFFKGQAVREKLFGRLFSGLLTSGILGGIWGALRYLAIPYLGTRFVATLIGAGFLVWLVFLLKYLLLRYSQERRSWQAEQIKLRYLSKKT